MLHFSLSWLAVLCWILLVPVHAAAPEAAPPYEYRSPAHPDGIGKTYLGREIAQVMGHLGIDWLERPEREQEERPDLLIEALDIRPGEWLADIGAGSGYHTRRLAGRVGSGGRVFAVDIQPEMLAALEKTLAKEGITNVVPTLGKEADPCLPANALDLVLMVDVYHELEYPYEMIREVCRALKPGGRLALVEFRAEDASVPIKELHKMSEQQVRREMEPHSLEWTKTIRSLPWQHVVLFRKSAAQSRAAVVDPAEGHVAVRPPDLHS